MVGNAAFLLGTLAEDDVGRRRVLSFARVASEQSCSVLQHLTHMLTSQDAESVMNAAGTMGTLVSELRFAI